jgi:hypothetical protein
MLADGYAFIIWRIAQFDWLLTKQDFPVLPMHGHFYCPAKMRGEPSFNRSK